ncbi:hypothetical protein ACKKBF_B03980 [Auxenochlorella protothecoides x Auxenochlorella symbiontica]
MVAQVSAIQVPAGSGWPIVVAAQGAGVHRGEDVAILEANRPWPGAAEPSGHSTDSAATGPPANGLANGGSAHSTPHSHHRPAEATYSVFAVFDGHNGAAAAQLAGDKALGLLEDRLPWGAPPADVAGPGARAWRCAIQRALVETLVELNWLFAGHGVVAGCTATIVLQVGWLLTAAGVGDSRALLDLGSEVVHLTEDHRVASHKGERRRLEGAGARVAPIHVSGYGPAASANEGIGPLRVWPGGLCLSRAVGDFDVGKVVLPFPHVKQVLVPETGARLYVASDGLWDAFERDTKVASMARAWSPEAAPSRLINAVLSLYEGLKDDTTILVADLLPPGQTFADVCAPHTAMAAVLRQGQRLAAADAVPAGCGCFGGGRRRAAQGDKAPQSRSGVKPRPKVRVLVDADVAGLLGLMAAKGEAVGAGGGAAEDAAEWYDADVGAELIRVTEEAAQEWRRAMTCRYNGQYVPEPEPSTRWARGFPVALRDAAPGEAAPEDGGDEGEAPSPAMSRSVSTFFRSSVAQDGDDYAAKFGHYKTVPGRGGGTRAAGAGHGAEVDGSTSVRVRTPAQAPPPPSPSASNPSVHVGAARGGARAGVARGSPLERSASSSIGEGTPPGSQDPSVRVGSPLSAPGAHGDEEPEGLALLVARESSRDNPRVHFGRQDSLQEAGGGGVMPPPAEEGEEGTRRRGAPAGAGPSSPPLAGLRPVRVVRRQSGTLTLEPAPSPQLAAPGTSSPRDIAPSGGAWEQGRDASPCTPDVALDAALGSSGSRSKMPVILEA